MGWSRHLTGATTTESGPAAASAASGCASRRSTAIRCPTVSERGERRSCGRVSQPGKQATLLSGRKEPSAAVRSSASRAVAVTARMNRPSRAVMAAVSTGRSAGGAIRSVPIRSVPSEAAAPDPSAGAAPVSNARLSRGSSATMLRIPARLMVSLGQRHAVVTALGRLRPSARPRRGGGVHVRVMAAGYSGTSRACVKLPHLVETGGHALSRPFEFTSRAAWFARRVPSFARSFAVRRRPGGSRRRPVLGPPFDHLRYL